MSSVTERDYFDVETGVLDRCIFADEDIYRQELERIFARAWNFVCHESQIPEPGDYFTNWIGEDEVVAVRGRDGVIRVLLNTCPHRGNKVCRAEIGNAKRFVCSYHGWRFDLDGALVGMPKEDVFYRGNLDKRAWGMTAAAQVASYQGFVFATLDAAAPPLEDYLGWVGRLGMDFMAAQGEVEFLDGVQKNRVRCNWKLAVDNVHDWYHVGVSHGSSLRAGLFDEEFLGPTDQMVLLGEYGHGISGPGITERKYEECVARLDAGERSVWYDAMVARRRRASAEDALGPVGRRSFGHPNIFPNLWVSTSPQVCLRIPRGPLETELWWFTYQTKEMSEGQRRRNLYMANHYFGPAGLLEQDDAENWSHATSGAKGAFSRTLPANLTMGKGADRVLADRSGQARVETVVNEHGQRWTYQSWQEWMRAENWRELIASHSMPPTGAL